MQSRRGHWQSASRPRLRGQDFEAKTSRRANSNACFGLMPVGTSSAADRCGKRFFPRWRDAHRGLDGDQTGVRPRRSRAQLWTMKSRSERCEPGPSAENFATDPLPMIFAVEQNTGSYLGSLYRPDIAWRTVCVRRSPGMLGMFHKAT
jgi:hypothetical protein